MNESIFHFYPPSIGLLNEVFASANFRDGVANSKWQN